VHLVNPNSTTTYIETLTNDIGTLPLEKLKGGGWNPVYQQRTGITTE